MLSSDNLLDGVLYGYNLLLYNLNFFDLLLDVGNLLDNFLDPSINHNLLFNARYLHWLRLYCVLNDHFFHNCRYLHDLLDGLSHGNQPFDNAVNWNWDLDRNNNLLIDFDNLGNLNLVVDNLLNWNISRDFSDYFNHVLSNALSIDDLFFNSLKLNDLVNNLLNDSIHFDIDVLLNKYFLNALLNNWHLHRLLYFLDTFLNHHLGHNAFNDLRNFNHFLDYSWYHNHLFNHLLHFDNLGYFNHLLNDFLNRYLDFLNAVNMA